MAYLPRGIDPDLLVSQVQNTMPYLATSEWGAKLAQDFPPAQTIRTYQAGKPLSHFEYFQLCLSAHYLTCATPVPTDVDNQIRQRLWPTDLPLEFALQMADLVIESHAYDFTRVTARYTYGAGDFAKESVSGHLGEWFTVAAGAYCALRRSKSDSARAKSSILLEMIANEVNRHSEIFGSLWRTNDGLNCLKGSASLAHNFGDLDRVMDMWELDAGDPLRLGFYKLGVQPFDSNRKLRYLGRLWVAGELYKSIISGGAMALENHRHFALRKPKCLRQDPSFLITTGPFLDEWGTRVAQGLSINGAPSEGTLEVIEALRAGWERMPKTFGYGRALYAIARVHPELKLERIPTISTEAFARQWGDAALVLMDEIPSRAT